MHTDVNALSIRLLGSGGPFTSRRRTSSCAVVSIAGEPRILVDAGGGAFTRVGESELILTELDVILLSHMHIDHTGGLASLVLDMTMRERSTPIAIAGPSGRERVPGTIAFTEQLFGEQGAWSYLHTFENFALDVAEMPSEPGRGPHDVEVGAAKLTSQDIRIRSLAVPHGMMPSLAYRIDWGPRSVTFTGDIAEYSGELVAFAAGTSLLVCNMALPERDVPHGQLRIKPSAVGRLARDCSAEELIVTHLMPAIEDELDDSLAHVRESYANPIHVAFDNAVFEITAR